MIESAAEFGLPVLEKGPAETHRRNLVFTSAGDHSNLRHWLDGARDFDLWVTYYGDFRGSHAELADYYHQRKGSKFQNLHFVYHRWPELIARYDAVMVMDDDILITGGEIGRLFAIRGKHDLWVLQPAFSPLGKISWDITRVRPECVMRYTNFVEMTCPLFRADKLALFMAVYDPVLVGYGADWWFLHCLGPELEGRVAVVDEITCINPRDSAKGGRREIDTLQEADQRIATWQRLKHQHKIPAEPTQITQYGCINRDARQLLEGPEPPPFTAPPK